MKLTGKCKEDFEKWYVKQGLNFNVVTDVEGNKDTYYIPVSCFNDYPKSMQYGVYEDFFRSVKKLKSISEARASAIEKENEIYNAK